MNLNNEQVAVLQNKMSGKLDLLQGPARLKCWPWTRVVMVLEMAGNQSYFIHPNVHMCDAVTVEVQIQVFFKPSWHRIYNMMLKGKLFKVPSLARSNWQTPLREYSGYIVRRSLLTMSWKSLLDDEKQVALEQAWQRQFDFALGDALGISINEVRLIWVKLPSLLQDMVEREQKLKIIKHNVDDETYKRIAQQEFSQGGVMGWPMLGGMQ